MSSNIKSRFADDVARGTRCIHERRWTDPCVSCGNGPDTARGILDAARREAEEAIASLNLCKRSDIAFQEAASAEVDRLKAAHSDSVDAVQKHCAAQLDALRATHEAELRAVRAVLPNDGAVDMDRYKLDIIGVATENARVREALGCPTGDVIAAVAALKEKA